MNAFVRNFIRIAALSIAIGIILIVISYSMNKSVFDNLTYGGYSIFGYNSDWSNWDDIGYNEDSDLNDREKEDGFSDSKLTRPANGDRVDSLSINIIAGTVRISEGDEFGIKVNDTGIERVKSEFINGVWTIEDTGVDASSNTGIRIFGINIDTQSLQNNITSVNITLPKDYKSKDISIKCGAGSIIADKLVGDVITISVGAGSCRIDDLTAKEKSNFTVGAGEIRLNNFTAYNANFDCSMGSIYGKGTLYGSNSAFCSMGTIDLNLKGQTEDYNYDGKNTMGTVTINESSYSGLNQSFDKNNGADNNIEISCNLGTISLKVSE